MEKVLEQEGLSRGCLGLRLPPMFLLSAASRMVPTSVFWDRLVPSTSPLTIEGH